MEKAMRIVNLREALTAVVNDGGQRADEVVSDAKKRYADNAECDWLAPTPDWEYSEDDCICDSLEKVIVDEYFRRIAREAAIVIRDTLKYDGTICISGRCPELTFDSRNFADCWNAQHEENPIDVHYTGYTPFGI